VHLTRSPAYPSVYPDREQIHPELLTMGVAEQNPCPKEPFNMAETFDVVYLVGGLMHGNGTSGC